MKKLVSLLLAAVLVLSVLGGGTALAQAAPEEEAAVSALVGDWVFYSRESDDPERNVPHEALPALLEQGLDYAGEETLSIWDDGWFKLCDFYGFEQNYWTDNGDNTGTLSINGETARIAVEDGLLVLRASDGVTRYERARTREIAVGTSGYVISVPVEYAEAEITADQTAFYRSDAHQMAFDLYQYAAEGRSPEEYAALEAEECGAESVGSLTVNGIPLVLYYAETEVEGVSCRTANYLFAAGEDLVKLSFRLEGEDAEALTGQIVASLEKEEDDELRGTVLEKLPGESFFASYRVLTESGELLECEYLGFDELAPGTEVVLSQWGPDWMIELRDDWSGGWSPSYPEPLYTTEDGVTVSDLALDLVAGRVWNFSYTLANPSEEDLIFKPVLFTLKTADGAEIQTAAPYLSDDEVSAGTRYFRISIGILSPELLELGDEVSVWYDGNYLGTVTAAEY